MNSKTLLILAVLTAAAVWGVFELVQRDDQPDPALRSGPLYPDLGAQLNELERVRLSSAGDTLIADLRREASGWTVANKSGYPADLDVLRELLRALAAARIIEPKTANPDWYAQLGVNDIDDPDSRALLLEVSGPEVDIALLLGDTVPISSQQRYVRRRDEAQSLQIDGNLNPPRQTRRWLNQPIVNIPGDQIQQVTIRHADGDELALIRDARDRINITPAVLPEGRELAYGSIANPIASTVTGLQLEDVIALDELSGERQPITEAEFLTFDGRRLNIDLFSVAGQRYLSARARFDADQHRRFAGEPVNDDLLATFVADPETISAEIEALDRRLQGWAYVVSPYNFDNLSQRLEDLLEPATGVDMDNNG